MTITRGYSFSPTEIVTAEKLDALVRNAQFSNINWAGLFESSGALPQNTNASGATIVGTLWAAYEGIFGLSGSTWSGQWSDYNYFIQSPNGPVGLFSQNRLELRHGCSMTAGRPPGSAVEPHAASSGSTLCLEFNTGTNTAYAPWRSDRSFGIGTVWAGSANSGATTFDQFPRVAMRGVSICYPDGVNAMCTLASPAFIAHTNAVGQQGTMSCSNVTNMFSIKGFLLEQKRSTGALTWLSWVGFPIKTN